MVTLINIYSTIYVLSLIVCGIAAFMLFFQKNISFRKQMRYLAISVICSWGVIAIFTKAHRELPFSVMGWSLTFNIYWLTDPEILYQMQQTFRHDLNRMARKNKKY